MMWKLFIFLSMISVCCSFSNVLENIFYRLLTRDKECDDQTVTYNNTKLSSFFDPESILNISNFQQKEHPLTFDRYMSYGEIARYLSYLKYNFGYIAEIVSIGKTSEGRNILAVHVNPVMDLPDEHRSVIVVDGGIHPREWISPAAALYLIYELVENSNRNSKLIADTEWYIIPVLNPDGYEYSLKVDPLWRKSRKKNKLKDSNCVGVDLNRNFDIDWMNVKSSKNPCSETYAGPRPFSEPESRALRNLGFRLKDKLIMYVTLHAFGPMLLYPYGYSQILPYNARELDTLAKVALRNSHFEYDVGSPGQILYPSSGGSDDYFKEKLNVPLVYTLELPPGGITGFDVEADRILFVVEDTYGIIRNLALYAVRQSTTQKHYGWK